MMHTNDFHNIYQVVQHQAEQNPLNEAIVNVNNERFSYQQFFDAINEASNILNDYNIQKNDRVLLVCENCIETVVFIFAANKMGACVVPLNARLTNEEINRVIHHSEPTLILFTSTVSKDAQTHADAFGADFLQAKFGSFSIAKADSPKSLIDPTETEDVAVILYTTGTTGTPKGVMLTHRNLIFAAQASAEFRNMTIQDRIYGVLPLTHVFGLASVLMATFYTGASVFLQSRFSTENLYNSLKSEVTIFPGVPQMHALLMEYVKTKGLDQLQSSTLRYVSSGAAPLDPTWKRKAEQFYQLPLQNGYGLTESTAGVCGTRNPMGNPDTSVGKALPDTELRIDSSLNDQDDSHSGEILARGPHIMKGYFNNREETLKVIDEQGWLHTGDIGKFDDQGNLHVVGRIKELIIRGGFNIYPPEVEAVFNDYPDVIQSAVIGRKVSNGDEEILAFVQCAEPDNLDLANLQDYISKRLVSYKRPSHIVLTKELPAAANGKILKHRLLTVFKHEVESLNL